MFCETSHLIWVLKYHPNLNLSAGNEYGHTNAAS